MTGGVSSSEELRLSHVVVRSTVVSVIKAHERVVSSFAMRLGSLFATIFFSRFGIPSFPIVVPVQVTPTQPPPRQNAIVPCGFLEFNNTSLACLSACVLKTRLIVSAILNPFTQRRAL